LQPPRSRGLSVLRTEAINPRQPPSRVAGESEDQETLWLRPPRSRGLSVLRTEAIYPRQPSSRVAGESEDQEKLWLQPPRSRGLSVLRTEAINRRQPPSRIAGDQKIRRAGEDMVSECRQSPAPRRKPGGSSAGVHGRPRSPPAAPLDDQQGWRPATGRPWRAGLVVSLCLPILIKLLAEE
jgi:hypothetical protein